jgi:ubiquitin-conjugating enzyme E2 D/E
MILAAQKALKSIHREISGLKMEDAGGVTLEPSEQSLFNWRESVPGPNSSFEAGHIL